MKIFQKSLSQKNIFSKLLPQNYSVQEDIFKIAYSKNINFIALIYSSTKSLELSEKEKILSLMCLIMIFLMYLHSFKNTFR